MVKRKRNSIGQFIPSGCVDKKEVFVAENLHEKINKRFYSFPMANFCH